MVKILVLELLIPILAGGDPDEETGSVGSNQSAANVTDSDLWRWKSVL